LYEVLPHWSIIDPSGKIKIFLGTKLALSLSLILNQTPPYPCGDKGEGKRRIFSWKG
jgi:hypothetical protein